MRRSRIAAAAVATVAGITMIPGVPSAHADPGFKYSFAGVGADSSQDVTNALSGGPVNNTTYAAIDSSAASGSITISSFDAIDPQGGTSAAPGAIITKLGGSLFDRPNGSGAGQAALSHAIDTNASNNLWEASTGSATGKPVNVAGQIDFARDLGNPKVSGSALDFIPYAQDAIGYAYISSNGDLASLTTSQLTGIYNGSITTIGTTKVKPCIPAYTSGVRSFFLSTIGVSDPSAGDGVDTRAQAAGCDNVEQNGFDAGLTTAGNGVVVPFAAASWIAQQNGVAVNELSGAAAAGFTLGNIDGLGVPYKGSAPNETTNTTFYASKYGTPIYYVVPDSQINDNSSTQNAALVELFYSDPNGDPLTGNPLTAAICQTPAQTLASTFGFELLSKVSGAPACGSIAKTGGLYENGNH